MAEGLWSLIISTPSPRQDRHIESVCLVTENWFCSTHHHDLIFGLVVMLQKVGYFFEVGVVNTYHADLYVVVKNRFAQKASSFVFFRSSEKRSYDPSGSGQRRIHP
jgi:hypothetical protein